MRKHLQICQYFIIDWKETAISQRILLYFTILFGTSCFLTGCIVLPITFLAAANSNHNHTDTSQSQHSDGLEEPVKLRSSYSNLSVTEVQAMQYIATRKKGKWGFYGYSTIKHDYVLKTVGNDKVVIDLATELMWHQSGSTYGMNWEKAKRWIKRINERGYAGYYDWRLPTIEEAASLLESRKTRYYYSLPKAHEHDDKCDKKFQGENANLDPCDRCSNALNCYILCCAISCYDVARCDVTTQSLDRNRNYRRKENDISSFINPIFDKTQGWIWTGDNYYRKDAAWHVDFFSGLVDWDIYYYAFYNVRPVRTIK